MLTFNYFLTCMQWELARVTFWMEIFFVYAIYKKPPSVDEIEISEKIFLNSRESTWIIEITPPEDLRIREKISYFYKNLFS